MGDQQVERQVARQSNQEEYVRQRHHLLEIQQGHGIKHRGIKKAKTLFSAKKYRIKYMKLAQSDEAWPKTSHIRQVENHNFIAKGKNDT